MEDKPLVLFVSIYNEGGRNKKYICRMVWRNLLIIGGEEKFQKGVKGGETWRFIIIIIMTMFMGDKNRNID